MPKHPKILWVSRHIPLASQLEELDRLFPGHVLIVDPRPFSGAREIVQRFRDAHADEMVLVAPWTVIRAITREGISPLWAEMAQTDEAHSETFSAGRDRRHYRFVKFHYCDGVELKLRPVVPPQRNSNLT